MTFPFVSKEISYGVERVRSASSRAGDACGLDSGVAGPTGQRFDPNPFSPYGKGALEREERRSRLKPQSSPE